MKSELLLNANLAYENSLMTSVSSLWKSTISSWALRLQIYNRKPELQTGGLKDVFSRPGVSNERHYPGGLWETKPQDVLSCLLLQF